MKAAADYVAAAWQEAGPQQAAQNVAKTAERAVQLALDDAEKYRLLLARATRNASQPQPTPADAPLR